MTELADRVAQLPAAKRELLQKLLQKKMAGAGAPQTIPRRPAGGPAPLSFAQQRLWFLDRLIPGSPLYNIPLALRMVGRLDLAALRASLRAIVRRHEALRTTFAVADGQPVQQIAPELDLPLPLIDLGGLPEESREEVARRQIDAAARLPFDLERGPLLRAIVLRLSEREHIAAFTIHHIVFDSWSIGVLVRELAALYAANRGQAVAPLPAPPIQYADFAVWQRDWLQGETLERQLAYWRRQLGGDLPVLELPADHPRPAVRSFQGGLLSRTFPRALADSLSELGRREEASLFMVLLAGFQALLARYTGQTDILVGTPIANRTRPEVEGLIGMFVNTLVLRTDLAGAPGFRALLARVRAMTLDAYAHQDLPFEQLVEELRPERDMRHTPLFQVLFDLQNAPARPLALPDLTLSMVGVGGAAAKFELTLSFAQTEQGLIGTAEYSADLFDADTIARLLAHLQTLLEAAVADPDRPIADLPLVTASERRQALALWNDTRRDDVPRACTHHLFEEQVAHTPDAVALVFEGRPTTGDKETRRQGDKVTRRQGELLSLSPQSSVPGPRHLTYDELNRRANQLARYLQSLGIGRGALVGLCVERGPELVIGLLGVFKAGAAYLPLDPAYPPERLAFMVDDSRASAVLLTGKGPGARDWGAGDKVTGRQATPSQAPSPTPQAPGARPIVIRMDDDAGIACGQDSNLAGPVTADDLAYVIYTSGSTGQPKGVLVPHRGLGNLAAAQRAAFGVQPGSRVLQFASISFDASVAEIVTTLLSGATLCLPAPDTLLAGVGLAQLLRDLRITTATLPPSVLATLPDEALPDLQHLVVAGEACPPALVARWTPGRRFVNAYGPTEATVCATIAACAAERQPPPIGRPIANTQVYLLNERLQPAPVGVPGELYIGGIGLAWGYLGQPGLTAERFIPNPFASAGDKETRRQGDKVTGEQERDLNLQSPISNLQSPDESETQNSRLYRTGDLGRYRPDGTIEFLGRADDQVKLRGFRVEPGEIEALLGRHPAVREAVVLMREDVPGDKRLVAYVVPATDKETRRQGDKESGRHGDTETRRQGDKVTGDASDPQSLALSPQDSAPPSSFILHPSSLGAELRAFLKERLPEHMVPAAVVVLEALPLTPNGKLDRRALMRVDWRGSAPQAAYVPPQTEAEQAIAAIWREALGVEQVGLHDNFFELGGHSLLVVQVHSRLREVFGREIAVVDLFQHPTVSSLAQHLAAHQPIAPSFKQGHDRAARQREAVMHSRRLMQSRGKLNG